MFFLALFTDYQRGPQRQCLLLGGANVHQVGTNNGTVTNNNGIYSLSLVSGPNTLEASYIGYKTASQTIGIGSYVNFILEEDSVD